METAEIIKEKYLALEPLLDEHLRRLWAATEAQATGWGGISAIARITGISRRAISDGLQELEQKVHPPEGYIRKPGGGRKSAVVHQPELPASLEKLIDPLNVAIRILRYVGRAKVHVDWQKSFKNRVLV